SGPTGHAMALDKVITKIIFQQHNIPTPDFWVLSSPDDDLSEISFPVIVKPKMEAVSYGLKVVNNKKDLRNAVKFIISEFQQQALVEQFIRGREFCVALLGNGDPDVFPIVEINLENDPDAIQTVEDKKQKPREKICPADLPSEIESAMIAASKKAFHSLELKDFARVDIRMDNENNIYILEINSMASLGKTGSYVHAAEKAGYTYSQLVNKMLDVAAVRYFSTSAARQEIKDRKSALSVRIRGFLRSRQAKTEKFLRKMTDINTHTRNIDGVNRCGYIIWEELSKLGFSQQVIPQIEIGNMLFFTNTIKKSYDVLLLGHLDSSISFRKQQNYHVDKNRIYGTDVWEYKGGIAVLISALQALRFVRKLPKVRIGILLTTDNKTGGRVAREHILNISRKTRVVIGLKGAGIKGTAITSRSGAAQYSCQMNFEKGREAEEVAKSVEKFTKILTRWTKLTDTATGVVVAPRKVEIDTNIAERVAHGEVILSVRFNTLEMGEEIDEKIRNVIKKDHSGNFRVQIEGGLRRPPLSKTENRERFWKRVKAIADKIDIRLLEEHRWSSSDVCFVQDNKPVIDGMGAVGAEHRDHSGFILRHSLLERATLLALILYDLSKER
ncbi:MAG: ATP-grasp domain-containing protein, partial [bacterium]